MRTWKVLAILALTLVASGGYWLGRSTSSPPAASQPAAADQGYAAGVRDGRAEQGTLGLPATDKQIFESGYEAGATDAFAGFDGGWDHKIPYAIVLTPGDDITYQISSRVEFAPGVSYYLCPDGHSVCHQAR
jgi:hypothetical protein